MPDCQCELAGEVDLGDLGAALAAVAALDALVALLIELATVKLVIQPNPGAVIRIGT